MALVIAACLASAALVALMAIACQGGEEAPPAATSTATMARSPTAAAATARPGAERQPRLIFLRRLGVIHISDDLAGSNAIQVTPADVRASFVGLSERSGTAILYYLASGETSDVFTLEARDLATGKTTTLASVQLASAASINPRVAVFPSGSLSPDGRYVALTHRDGLDLLDLTTNGRQNILPEACESRPGNCVFYANSTWSPDGRLLLVWTQGAFEGSELRIVDPFQQPAQITSLVYMAGAWSPTGDALCGWGIWDTGSGLCLSEGRDWQTRGLVPENETRCEPADVHGTAVTGCEWLDEHRIAFLRSGLSIYDLETAAVTEVADLGAVSPELFAVPESSTLVFNGRGGGQPGLLDTTDGTRTPILQPGDWVVAVTQPIALPEEIAAAEPEVQPCVPLTAECELRVSNVAPEQLNVRKGAAQQSEVTGSLSEGEIVCVTGSSVFTADGFWWWPVRLQSGVEGWAAQGDPQEPDRPWLTPTGRKCETPEEPPHAQSVQVDPPYEALSEERVLELTLAAQDTPGFSKLMDEMELARQAGIEPPPCDDLAFFYSWQVRQPYPPSGIGLRFTVGRIGEIFKPAGQGASGQEGIRCGILKVDNQSPVSVTVELRYVIATSTAPKTPNLAPGWTKIEPGGDTICAKGTPYAYFVHPGTVNRLAVYFDGGDICWSDATCSLLNTSYITVDDSDNPKKWTGIFDLDNPDNPFRDWFWVFVPYCTADLHWGNSTWTYHWGGADTVIHHKGFVNVTAVLGWIEDNFEKPEKILVWGSSAGSGGAIVHAAYIREIYPDVPLYEVGDSGAGVISEDLLESGFPNWGSRENLLNWIPALQVPLSELTMAKLYIALANYYPNTRWAQYNTAHDVIQAFSYATTGGSSGDWSQLMLASIREIQDNAPNFHSYTAPGAIHCNTASDIFYTREVNGVRFRDWVDAMVNDEAWDDVMCTDCETDPEAQP
jgi:hypothetical protein